MVFHGRESNRNFMSMPASLLPHTSLASGCALLSSTRWATEAGLIQVQSGRLSWMRAGRYLSRKGGKMSAVSSRKASGVGSVTAASAPILAHEHDWCSFMPEQLGALALQAAAAASSSMALPAFFALRQQFSPMPHGASLSTANDLVASEIGR